MSDFDLQLRARAATIDDALAHYLTSAALSGPGPAPERLIAAMRHGALTGGKRLRPLLLVETAGLLGVEEEATTQAAVALEMVHCYSLVHDDLPAMDDDDMRRGKPTVHKLFDEAAAILAGDGLLTEAFGLLSAPETHPDPAIRIQLVLELAKGAGAGGMAGGQMRDLEGENARLSDRDIAILQKMKTGALIRAAVRMGAILGGADAEALSTLTTYGDAVGRAFQLADDLLDETASAEQMGKATGKDAERGKQTIVASIGIEPARRMLGDTIHAAITALTPFGPEADTLRQIARYVAERES